MPLFKKRLSDVFKYEKSFSDKEADALEKYFSEHMIHAAFAYPLTKEKGDLKFLVEKARKRQPPKTPEEEKMLKQALGTAVREKWDPYMTYGAFMAVKTAFGKEKFDEKLREMYNKARENRRELADEVMLEFCTPAEREASLKEAKEYDVPIWQAATLNHEYKTMSEGLKREAYNIAKKTHSSPIEVVKEIIKQSGKK